MLDMLKQTGRPEMVVGWYHSHPGFGCWLSGVDINTQQSFEALSSRAVAVVVDPIQSVKGKCVGGKGGGGIIRSSGPNRECVKGVCMWRMRMRKNRCRHETLCKGSSCYNYLQEKL